MNNAVYQFLDDLGTQEFINVILEISESNVVNRIVGKLDETSTDEQILNSSACLALITRLLNIADDISDTIDSLNEEVDAIYRHIGGGRAKTVTTADVLTHLNIEFVTGDIVSKVKNPRDDILYVQHDSEDDTTWVLYVYDNNMWLAVGETKYELLNYWSKDDVGGLIDRFNEKFLTTITDDEIRTKAAEAFQRVAQDIVERYPFSIDTSTRSMILGIPDNENVDLFVNPSGNLILNYNFTDTDRALSRFKFTINEYGYLIANVQ